MRKYFNDLQAYSTQTDGSMRYTLMEEGRDPTFGELHAGEQVLLISPGELMAIATVEGPVRAQGREREHVYWIAIVQRPEAIVDLPLTEPYAGFPIGYDGHELWAELNTRDAQLQAQRRQASQHHG